MSATTYTASRVRDAGRERYSVIFRHPVRLDANGNPGRRVRRGLRTADADEADRIVAQINKLLGNDEYWSLTARPTAEGLFDPRAVAAFYDGMEPAPAGASAVLREREIPLPGISEGYRQILLLGPTGAGKTTLVRQLLGSHPERDRFPSISTARTTIADTELVIADGEYRAAVTFAARDEVIDHLADCASKAAAALLRKAPDLDVARALLDHENQRFRFSYVLGRHYENRVTGLDVTLAAPMLDDEESDKPTFDAEPEGLPGIDLEETKVIIDEAIRNLAILVDEHAAEVMAMIDEGTDDDTRAAQELIEEELDKVLRGREEFHEVVDSLVHEIEKRFDVLAPGRLARDQQGWPISWTFETADRRTFLRAVNRFTSNYAPQFGHLLSPLVDGIRVAGPFHPEWVEGEAPRLVLIDGEGLGHTAKSAVALPTEVAQRIDEVDAVVLVDNAMAPMLATPAAAVTSILASGHAAKLIFCFTHFDEVKGDNLGSPSDRAQHVLSSVENFLSSIGQEYQHRAEREIRNRLSTHCFFLANIDKPLRSDTPEGRQPINQMLKMLQAIETITERPELGPARPVYDKANLVLAVAAATASFHRRWGALLGLTSEPDIDKEHWTRVKALNRRFAERTADRYDTLRPVSDLHDLLQKEIYKSLDTPMGWTGGVRPDPDGVTATINEFSQAIWRRLFSPLGDRLRVRPVKEWQAGWRLSGTGSTSVRARLIANDVFAAQVPTPRATPAPDHNEFLHSVVGAIEAAADEVGVILR